MTQSLGPNNRNASSPPDLKTCKWCPPELSYEEFIPNAAIFYLNEKTDEVKNINERRGVDWRKWVEGVSTGPNMLSKPQNLGI